MNVSTLSSASNKSLCVNLAIRRLGAITKNPCEPTALSP